MTFSRYDCEEFVQSIYCYPDTGILRNKLGIKDFTLLKEAETQLTQLRLYKLQREPIEGRFTVTHFLKIHKYIFQDVYHFAGKIREETIIKGDTKFCESQFIKENLEKILNELKTERYLKGKCAESFANRSAYYMAELNFIHPFREGNGRALREFVRCLGIKCGYSVNWDAVDKDILLRASILSVKDPAELANCIRICIENE